MPGRPPTRRPGNLYERDGSEASARWDLGTKRKWVTQFQSSSPFYRPFASYNGYPTITIGTRRTRWFLSSNGDFILWSGESLYSPDYHYELAMQRDCNLVEYDRWLGRAIWATMTNGRGTDCYAVLQGDGNFVVYRERTAKPEYALWGSGVRGLGDYQLLLQNNGRLTEYRGSSVLNRQEAVWSPQ